MSRPIYNEKYDYKAAHLSWIRSHPNFTAKFYNNMPGVRCNNLVFEKSSYYDIMVEWYLTGSNFIAYLNYYDDLRWLEEQDEIKKHLNTKPFVSNCSFVTIGFNHQEFTVKKAFEFIQSVLNLSVVLDGSFAVLEYHRQNGEHPHVHFKMYYSGQTYKSVLIQAIYRAKHAKKLILNKNFIDIKEFIETVHDNYLDGNKQENKMPFVEKDKSWRSKNNIPDKLFKDTKLLL